MGGGEGHLEEPPADEEPWGRIACGAQARRSVSPATKDEPVDEEQRERTRTGAKHLRIFSLASKAVGPPGGVSTVPARLQAINGPDAPLPQRLLSGPDSIAQMLLSGPEVGPSFSSSAQSPMSEAKECTLLLCRNNNVGGETGFGSTLRRASAGRRDGLGLNAMPSRAQG